MARNDNDLDYEYELGNGWDQWQNVVLRGMREIKEQVVDTHKEVQDLKTGQAVLREIVDRVEKIQKDQGTDIEIERTRVNTLEAQGTRHRAFLSGSWKALGITVTGFFAISGFVLGLLQVIS